MHTCVSTCLWLKASADWVALSLSPLAFGIVLQQQNMARSTGDSVNWYQICNFRFHFEWWMNDPNFIKSCIFEVMKVVEVAKKEIENYFNFSRFFKGFKLYICTYLIFRYVQWGEIFSESCLIKIICLLYLID